jgi:molybdopterin synthase catalytic subunit
MGDPVSLDQLIESVKDNVKGKNCGSVVTFTGIVRPKTHSGEAVDHLEYEVFEEGARAAIAAAVSDLMKINGVLDVALCHRYGSFLPGEEVVYIVIAAEKSETAFQALRLAVDLMKHSVLIWKKEFTTKGGLWVGL